MAHERAAWLHQRLPFGSSPRFAAGDKMNAEPSAGRLATSLMLTAGSAALHSGGQNWAMADKR